MSTEYDSTPRKMSERGKQVLKDKLLYRRKSGSTKKRVVTAYCGVLDDGANLTLNDYEKPGQKPKSMIPLEGAKIDHSGSTYSSPSRMSASLSPSPHGSLGGSDTGLIIGSGSGSRTVSSGGNMCAFTVITRNGQTHEFMTESENDRLLWVKVLTVLVMFPYSTIPDEPKNMSIKDSLRSRVNPEKYNADSVWLVYILPEEVGMKCHIIGINVIALKSGVKDLSSGHIKIYNAADPSTPLISWDRDKVRRTGKMGNLVFIETGRRCEGGPGLLWMYMNCGAQTLRETLHNFLFKGDGRAVAIPTQGTRIYDVPRSLGSSVDASFPPSNKCRISIPGYILSRSKSHDHDSGYPGSPVGSVNMLPQLNGPPVRLDKHPSTEFDGYVTMKPAESHTPSDDTYHHLQHRPSPQNSSSPQNRSNYDQLPTMSEEKRLYSGTGPTNYENHPLPRHLKGVSVEYKPNYQNIEMARRSRRGWMNQDKYENVGGEQWKIFT